MLLRLLQGSDQIWIDRRGFSAWKARGGRGGLGSRGGAVSRWVGLGSGGAWSGYPSDQPFEDVWQSFQTSLQGSTRNGLFGILRAGEEEFPADGLLALLPGDGHEVAAVADALGAIADPKAIPALQKAFAEAAATKGKPTVIIAHTVKGKGVSFMENNPKYHGVAPTAEEVELALKELA